MTSFLAFLAAFMLFHLVPAAPAISAHLVAAMGRGIYIAVYSLLSIVLLAWVVVAARQADDIIVWEPSRWQFLTPFVLMPFAIFLVLAGLLKSNPLSLSLRGGDEVPAIAAITRHPGIWGLLLWALSHLLPNGRLIPIVLFGSMAALAALSFWRLDGEARTRMGEESWSHWARHTSIVPFAAMLVGRSIAGAGRMLCIHALEATIIYVWFVFDGHAWLIRPSLRHVLDVFL
jgi:uncharacterized membrane protein